MRPSLMRHPILVERLFDFLCGAIEFLLVEVWKARNPCIECPILFQDERDLEPPGCPVFRNQDQGRRSLLIPQRAAALYFLEQQLSAPEWLDHFQPV